MKKTVETWECHGDFCVYCGESLKEVSTGHRDTEMRCDCEGYLLNRKTDRDIALIEAGRPKPKYVRLKSHIFKISDLT